MLESPHPERLRMEGVQKRFGPTVALGGVSLTVRVGEILGLVGENGAGKSTLVKILAGVYSPDAGSMMLDKIPFRPPSPLAARKAGIAMIHQELSLAPDLSVAENIVLGMEPGQGPWMNWKETKRLAAQALSAVGLDHIDPAMQAKRLSAAESQLVEIGRAVVIGCRVLVLDEPTSSLTDTDTARLFALITDLKKRGHAIIYISHFLEEIRTLCDRLTILRDGLSVGEGRPEDFTDGEIVAKMVGRSVDDLYPRSKRTAGKIILETDSLAGETKPTHASIQVRRGEVLGIAGLVGAGRTEFLRAIFGLDAFRAGRVRIGTLDGPATPHQRWESGVGFLSEDRKREGLALDLCIGENITLTKLRAWVKPADQARESDPWINRLQIKCLSAQQTVSALSGGNQQKVALARLLSHGVDLLLLDEPTRGIDIGAKAIIYRLIDDLAKEGKAIVVVSSYLPELLGVCDRIAVMSRGVLGTARSIEEIDAHSLMLEATGKAAKQEAQ